MAGSWHPVLPFHQHARPCRSHITFPGKLAFAFTCGIPRLSVLFIKNRLGKSQFFVFHRSCPTHSFDFTSTPFIDSIEISQKVDDSSGKVLQVKAVKGLLAIGYAVRNTKV